MKRLFSKREIAALAVAQCHRCAICGGRLTNTEGDHIHPFSKGGATSFDNGQAACRSCNRQKSNKIMSNLYSPKSFKYRHWQRECLLKFEDKILEDIEQPAVFSLQAWPGAGKTKLATAAFCTARDNGLVDKLIWVVPSTTLKQDIGCYKRNSDLAAEGISSVHDISNTIFRDQMKEGRCSWPQGKDAWMVTYRQIASEPEMFKALCSVFRCMLILDEVHHVRDSAAWGHPVRQIGEMCKVVMPMSGTLFTTNGDEIPFVGSFISVNDQGKSIRTFEPDYSFGMKDAVSIQPGETHPSIRTLTYSKFNARGEFTYKNLQDDKTFTIIHDLKGDGEKAKLTQLLKPNSEMVYQMLQGGINSLNRFRQIEGDTDAGGLIVCMDGNHAKAIAEVLRNKFGEDPVVILHDTDQASAAIDQFRNSDKRWCVTVRMISEGVDITRLRVGVYLTNYLTYLFLMQWLGRMWRWDKTLGGEQDGEVIIPAHEMLVKWVSELEDATYEAIIKDGQSGEDETPARCSGIDSVNLLTDSAIESEYDGGIKRGESFSQPAFDLAVHIHEMKNGAFSLGTIAAVLEAAGEYRGKAANPITKEEEDREQELESIKRLIGAAKREIIKNPPVDWDGVDPYSYLHGKLNRMAGGGKWAGKFADLLAIKERKENAKQLLAQFRRL